MELMKTLVLLKIVRLLYLFNAQRSRNKAKSNGSVLPIINAH